MTACPRFAMHTVQKFKLRDVPDVLLDSFYLVAVHFN